MPIIDVHAHIYPQKIAQKASDAVGEFYTLEMYGDGTVEQLLQSKEAVPITNFVVHSVATTPKSVESINNFIAAECKLHPEFIGFMSMHQDHPDPESEIKRAMDLGLCGMKLHPDTQKVDLDDPRLMKVYELIEGRLPAIIHMGDYRYDYSHPRRLQKVLREFPNLVVNAAHFGGWSIPDIAYDHLKDENCFFDVSSSMAFLGKRRTRELCDMYGPDRILFGSDYPMANPVDEFNRFSQLGFSEVEKEKMLWRNAERFIGRDIG